jgi:hypothetical protein
MPQQVVFTPEACEAIYALPKVVVSQIAWKQYKPCTFRFEAKVLCDNGEILDLYGHWKYEKATERRSWGFSLRYLGHVVRSYDMATKHKNPSNGWVRGAHKHKFQSSKIPRFAYKPNPPISEANANDALMDFLEESNIQKPADYQDNIFI